MTLTGGGEHPHLGLQRLCAQALSHVWLFCDPMDCSPPGFSVYGISQARILEWVAVFFSRGSFQPRERTQVSLIAGRFFTSWATNEVRENRGAHKIQRLRHKSTLRQSLALLCLFLPNSCFIFPQPALQFSQLSMCHGEKWDFTIVLLHSSFQPLKLEKHNKISKFL